MCTLPPTTPNFVSEPDFRGTLGTLWRCLFTILACTWTIQHLNIPEQRDRSVEKTDGYRALASYVRWQAKEFLA